jgi:Transglutaminase-like superfamily
MVNGNKWRKFLRLSWPEMSFFFLALVLLPATALALKLMGLRRTQALLMRLTPAPGTPSESNASQHSPSVAIDRIATTTDNGQRTTDQRRVIANLVRAAASHGPYRANCLKQSLALWWLLRLKGIESALRIGVRKAPAGVEAHAWIECSGRPLNDHEDVLLLYPPFDRAIVPC